MRSRMLTLVLVVGSMGLAACDSNDKSKTEAPPAKTDSSIASIPPAPEYSTPTAAPAATASPEVTFVEPTPVTTTFKPIPVKSNKTATAKGATTTTGSPASATATAGGKYTVQKGDTLWKIAQQTYGSGKKYKDIVAANPGVDPNRIKVGQVISLP